MEYFIQISNFTLVINPQNGKNFMLDGIVNELSQSTKSKLISNGFYDSLDSVFPDTEKMNIVNPTICITSHCNLSCKYCFRKDFSFKLETISFDKCIDFIKFMQNYYPSYEYMRLDLTGYGEPLIAIDQIKKIVSISKSLSEPKKVIDVGFATNGTLLNVEITDYLKQNQIYYGISIDGLKKENDSNRRGKNIKSVFELVNSNLSYVDKSFIGVSSTLTYKTKNLVKNYDYFVKRFATITMKPVQITLVQTMRFELTQPYQLQASETCVSTNSTTSA